MSSYRIRVEFLLLVPKEAPATDTLGPPPEKIAASCGVIYDGAALDAMDCGPAIVTAELGRLLAKILEEAPK